MGTCDEPQACKREESSSPPPDPLQQTSDHVYADWAALQESRPLDIDSPAMSSGDDKGLIKKLKRSDGLSTLISNGNRDSGKDSGISHSEGSDGNTTEGGHNGPKSSEESPITYGASSKITGVTNASAKVSPKVEEAFSPNPFIKLNHKEFPNAAANMTSPIVNSTPHRLFLQNDRNLRRERRKQFIREAATRPRTLIQDERELKREWRKQCNREAAERSRLKKLALEDQLAAQVEALNTENLSLKSQINWLTINSEKLKLQNANLMMLPDTRCFPSCYRSVLGEPACAPESSQYKGTLDVFYKVTRQEGFGRLWRGTGASLALAVPTVGIYLPCYDIFRNFMEEYSSQNASSMTPYVPLVAGSVARSLACISCYPVELARTRMQAFKAHSGKSSPGVLKTLVEIIATNRSTNSLQSSLHSSRFLWTGLGAQLARDVPFSAICWATLEPVRRQLLAMSSDETSPVTVLGANFSAGIVAGCLAAASTCPLDVAKTRRQIEKDQVRALNMTTRQTLVEIWRDGGMKGLFMGVGPRVGRAGPSVGIVVSFYEVVKYVLHNRKHRLPGEA
ncbi:Mitochondrial carrier domain-containing protein [Artemisia annua]|uniref:Mitochondrial carrier domain-containing protein n=1 Tax=Artemisia annua TaxID=35608 RepID=A0A2U1MGI8_ARTAN|nr:Mitochondrial carrier domain-containing protein [Artemisia annua]